MENKNIIQEELSSISPVVAGIGNRHPYVAPPGYFDTLPVQVMLRIALEEKSGADPVLNISKQSVYQAPAGYFDGLAGQIMTRIKAQENNAAEELALLSPLLGQISKKTPFSPPEGYFNEFSDNILAGVKAVAFVNEELENLSPLMASLRDKQVYKVPDGYFNATPGVILQKAKQGEPAKVVTIGFRHKLVRYAAAAVAAGILALGGYLYHGNPANQLAAGNGKPSALDSGLAKIPDQEIESFLNNNTPGLADLGTDADSANAAATDNVSAGSDDAKDLLADISDAELQQYVDQRPETPISN